VDAVWAGANNPPSPHPPVTLRSSEPPTVVPSSRWLVHRQKTDSLVPTGGIFPPGWVAHRDRHRAQLANGYAMGWPTNASVQDRFWGRCRAVGCQQVPSNPDKTF
jgi:hypothetical protein